MWGSWDDSGVRDCGETRGALGGLPGQGVAPTRLESWLGVLCPNSHLAPRQTWSHLALFPADDKRIFHAALRPKKPKGNNIIMESRVIFAIPQRELKPQGSRDSVRMTAFPEIK